MDDFTGRAENGRPYNGQKLPTSKDVARLAGVSQSSVCRVFSPKWNGKISDAVRAKVHSAAEALGYNPNAIARSLTASRSGIIGVVVSEEFNEFYYDLLCRVTNLIQRQNMRVMVFNSRPFSDINPIITQMLEYRVDGIIVSAAALTGRIANRWVEQGFPLVLINIYGESLPFSSVCSDNYGGARDTADYLCACGCKNFAVVSAEKSKYIDVVERLQGFADGLKQNGIESFAVEPGDYSYQSGKEAARALLRKTPRPDTVFCMGARMALGVMDTARYEFGLRVPEDVSVVGYGDLYAPELDSYRLTTLDQPSELIARDVVRLLVKQMEEGVFGPEHLMEPMHINVRGSVRKHPPLL